MSVGEKVYQISRKRLIATGLGIAMLFGATGATVAALLESGSGPSTQRQLTLAEIREAGQLIGEKCMTLHAEGTTTLTGSKRAYTVERTFAGGISCRAVMRGGKIVDVSINEPAAVSGNGSQNVYDLRFRNVYQTGQNNDYSWQYYEGTAPGQGNLAGAAVSGFAYSDGTSQAWVAGATEHNTSPDGPFDSSLQIGNTNKSVAGQALFEDVVTAMESALEQVKPL
jgi:hypothetical protein